MLIMLIILQISRVNSSAPVDVNIDDDDDDDDDDDIDVVATVVNKYCT